MNLLLLLDLLLTLIEEQEESVVLAGPEVNPAG